MEDINELAPLLGVRHFGKIRRAKEGMSIASKLLDGLNPWGAIKRQRDALRRLRSLKESLDDWSMGKAAFPFPVITSRQWRAGSGVSGSFDYGYSAGFRQGDVEIPGEEDHRPPKQLREEILEAMKEKPPPPYERPVMQYYENIVR
jgi:hypothetical protein